MLKFLNGLPSLPMVLLAMGMLAVGALSVSNLLDKPIPLAPSTTIVATKVVLPSGPLQPSNGGPNKFCPASWKETAGVPPANTPFFSARWYTCERLGFEVSVYFDSADKIVAIIGYDASGNRLTNPGDLLR